MRAVLLLNLCLIPLLAQGADNWWPSWRGPDGSGAAQDARLPLTWDENNHIKWKRDIPGRGLATPVIWGDKLFILTAVATDQAIQSPAPEQGSGFGMKSITPDKIQKFEVLALNRHDGSTLWQRTAIESAPHESTHGDASWASGSPVTDGRYLLAYFGSRGLFAYDLEGNLKWRIDLGDMATRNGFGEGSSPAIFGDRVIVNWDHEGDSFIVALELATGKEIWRKQRDEPTSWSTPSIVTHGGRTQVIVSATNKIRAYDLANGDEIWSCGGMTLNTIPSPIVQNGIVYLASGFRGNALLAISLDRAKGDITDGDAILWRFDRDTPYVPGMLLYQNLLYVIKSNNAIITCFDAATGKVHYGPTRLDELKGVYASPVGAGDRIYIPGRAGATAVLERGPEFKLLAVNKLDDRFDASPAIAGNMLYLRGHKSIYCIAE